MIVFLIVRGGTLGCWYLRIERRLGHALPGFLLAFVSTDARADDQIVAMSAPHELDDLVPATRRRTLGAVARNPFPSQRVSALIRWHGVRLWLRRLPVVPRRSHEVTKGVVGT